MTLGAPLVRFRPEDCPAMPARRRTGNENLRKKFQFTAKWPDSTIDIAAQLLPPRGRVKTATLPRQGNSSIKLTAFGRSFCLRTSSWFDFIGTRYVLEPAIPGARMARMNRPPRNRSH